MAKKVQITHHSATNCYITVQVTPEQKALLASEAKLDGMALSRWMRWAALEAARERQHRRLSVQRQTAP